MMMMVLQLLQSLGLARNCSFELGRFDFLFLLQFFQIQLVLSSELLFPLQSQLEIRELQMQVDRQLLFFATERGKSGQQTQRQSPLQAPDTFPIASGVNSAFFVNLAILSNTASTCITKKSQLTKCSQKLHNSLQVQDNISSNN